MTPQVNLAPHSGATGSLVTGEMLHVALLRYANGAADRLHSHPNEQFTFVVEGALRVEIDGGEFTVGKHCVVHVPPGMPHRIAADGDALVVTLQDTRHAFAG